MAFKDFVGNTTGSGTGIIGAISNYVVPAIFAFAFASFVWGVMNYFFIHGGEEAKRKEGRMFVLWGIIGMVILFSVWGFVNIMLSTLGITPS